MKLAVRMKKLNYLPAFSGRYPLRRTYRTLCHCAFTGYSLVQITNVFLGLLFFSGPAAAQDPLPVRQWLSPARKVVAVSSDNQWLLSNWPDGDTIGIFENTGSGRKLKFSRNGKVLVTYGATSDTEIYRLETDSCYKIATLPFAAEAVAFSHSGIRLFLLHSGSWLGMQVSIYDTQSGTLLAAKRISAGANALTVSMNDSLIGLSAGTLIRLLWASDLRAARVHWEAQKQRLLVGNPAVPLESASVTPADVIQVRDLAAGEILTEIKAHDSPVVWLDYAPGGQVLASLDTGGNLYAWSLPDKQCLFRTSGVHHTPAFDSTGVLYWHTGAGWTSADLTATGRPGAFDTLTGSGYFIRQVQEPVEFLPQPLTAYTREAGILLGAKASVLYYPASARRYPPHYLPSSIIPYAAFAPAGRQVHTGVEIEAYSPGGWYFFNNLSYNFRERNFFFGLGNHTRRTNRQAYFMNSFALNGQVLRNLTRTLKLGLGYTLRYDTRVDTEAEITVRGASGGRLAGTGPLVQVDTRDDILFPRSGSLFSSRFFLYNPNLWSDFQYQEMVLDFRKYFPVNFGNSGSVLAFQGFVHATWAGEAPFYHLPYLTSDRVLRGVWRNLYINRQVAFVQAEFRSFIFPGDNRFGYVLFAGAGDGADNFLNAYPDPAIKVAYGAGYRHQLVPKLRLDLRFDLALTNKRDFGVFVGTGVAF